jgi:catechol 2,3-dioxygenase-like lactoylglutathione lyase family enzyme
MVRSKEFYSATDNSQKNNASSPIAIKTRFEHIAFNVPDPVAMTKWYTTNLGMKILRAGSAPTYTTFLADSGEHMMFELFYNAEFPVIDLATVSHMSVHIAFMVDDIQATKSMLVAAGAKVIDDITKIATGDSLLMMRDPWGLSIQFVKRVNVLLK